MKLFHSLFITFMLLAFTSKAYAHTDNDPAQPVDTAMVLDKVQVTAIKQGMTLQKVPAASVIGAAGIERRHVDALKNLSQDIPNLLIPDYGSRMTSSIYIRGLGARIDQPVMGLNVDNVPIMNKNAFDMELADAERIEVLRGPQSTLYGRNTMGGVMNVYTLSPMHYQGIRFKAEYSSGKSYRIRASVYEKFNDNWAISVAGFHNHTGGFFRNRARNEMCDHEDLSGGRWKLQWRKGRWSIDNTFACSVLDQGGYPYAYIGEDKFDDQGRLIIAKGEIAYNDPAGYERTSLTEGLTLRYDAPKFTLLSLTGYQLTDDRMTLDQDFQPLSYFTLNQSLTEHCLTQDVVIRSRGGQRYGWLFGAFGFYRHGKMSAPVLFKRTGIEELIFKHANEAVSGYAWDAEAAPEWELPLESNFKMPSCGMAVYHESRLESGRWSLTAGIRIDREKTTLKYHSRAELPYTFTTSEQVFHDVARINDRNSISHVYTEVLPKFTVLYALDEQNNLYASVARGYKAGGFNTQMFSDILQEKIKWEMTSGIPFEESDIMSYKPEYSWNYELGCHFSACRGDLRGEFSVFLIHVHDQQLTVFPKGQSTGRMTTNAGRTRSAGVEFSTRTTPWRHLMLNLAYGYTHAEFRNFDNGHENFAGKRVPYAPAHTLSLGAVWTIPTRVEWLGDLVLQGGMRGVGDIWWNEENTLRQPFYALFDASLRFEHKRYSIDIWGRNLTDTGHDVFYFKSMGNEFVQRGRKRTFGLTLNLNLSFK